jgi:quercetin dioxygenase-like cupin family protein
MAEARNLDDLPAREHMPGFAGRFLHSGGMTFVWWTIAPGATFTPHSHPHEQVVNMLEGEFEITVDGKPRRLRPGDVLLIPGHAVHDGRALTACRILDVFAPVREEYRFPEAADLAGKPAPA